MTRFAKLFLTACGIASIIFPVQARYPCVPRDFDKGGTVCVCNSTYCDTIDPAERVTAGKYLVYSSSIDGLRLEKSEGNFSDSTLPSGVKYTIDRNRTYQKIFGFGTAFTDAAGINLLKLNSTDSQDKLLKAYFSSEGIELNFGRVPIGGCDFSTHTYSYDDVENDTNLSNFSLTMEDDTFKIPIIKRAQKFRGSSLKLLASAWSPPIWMKTNNDFSGFGFLHEEFYDAWAKYHIKFLDEYKKNGLKFWGLTTGNEPLNGIVPINRFNSLGWSPQGHREWIGNNLGPLLRNSEHNATKLLALDDQRFLLPWWLELVFQNEDAKSYIDGVGVHWYWDTLYPATALSRTHMRYPGKFILATEACVGDKPWDREKVMLGSWTRGEMYIKDIIEDLNHWVTGWIDWNFALNPTGGPNWANNFVDSAIIVDEEKQEFYKQPMFYALGHFSKFIHEGSKRVHLQRQKGPSALQTVAFLRPDQAMVVVVFNGRGLDVPLILVDPKRGTIRFTATKHSVHTVIYW
ncbi:Hypothetical predicted protein [Cloeon dipterum]|uniref:Glucosylceramidase n=3 Tax=Cloeon dipterum TaxID=197152 RepID=A0A8S1DGE1_9INSE|nr:Hypothetical predicted protein [Cloeon dipterum]